VTKNLSNKQNSIKCVVSRIVQKKIQREGVRKNTIQLVFDTKRKDAGLNCKKISHYRSRSCVCPLWMIQRIILSIHPWYIKKSSSVTLIILFYYLFI